MADRDGNPDPYRGYRFRVELSGVERGGFRECSGLDFTQDPIEYREGSDAMTPRKLPGLYKFSNIVLKWGIADSRILYDWYAKAAMGKVERKNGSIVLHGTDGSEKLRWNFIQGWPTTWKGPELNAKSNEAAIVSLEIAHEGLEQA